jgi:hypothetical protein
MLSLGNSTFACLMAWGADSALDKPLTGLEVVVGKGLVVCPGVSFLELIDRRRILSLQGKADGISIDQFACALYT